MTRDEIIKELIDLMQVYEQSVAWSVMAEEIIQDILQGEN